MSREDCPPRCSSASSNAGPSIRRAPWHGYAGYADGYAMVDPNKLMLLTPGIDRKTGEYLDFGVPATVLANYLREQRIVPEKCDLNSILFLMTPAEDEQAQHADREAGQVQEHVGSRRAARRGAADVVFAERGALRGLHAAQVCKEMHDFYARRT